MSGNEVPIHKQVKAIAYSRRRMKFGLRSGSGLLVVVDFKVCFWVYGAQPHAGQSQCLLVSPYYGIRSKIGLSELLMLFLSLLMMVMVVVGFQFLGKVPTH